MLLLPVYGVRRVNILKGFIMNRGFILSAFLVVGLGASVLSAHVEVDENNQNPTMETIEKGDDTSAAEIKIVQALVEELEKKLADSKSEADLKALVEETQQLAAQLDETQKTFDAEFLKLAALGAVEGSFIPVLASILNMFDTNGYCKISQSDHVLFFIMILSGALSKPLAAKMGILPQAKLSDFLTGRELLTALVAGVAQVGLLGFYNMCLTEEAPALLKYAVQAFSVALPISTTTFLKRLEKRNAVKDVVAN